MAKIFNYVGSELDLFAGAKNWKGYWSKRICPFLGARVLDVGAGIGATARLLCGPAVAKWVALEPDPLLASRIRELIVEGELPSKCEVRVGMIADLPPGEEFDSILYVDVLEHILEDRKELDRASVHLAEHGRIVVLSPAHHWLFTPFDEALGHYRRYNGRALKDATPKSLDLECSFYLDSAGLLASLGNRLLLNSAHAKKGQIEFWDRVLVPISRMLDPLTGHRVGKSIVGIWRKR